jgi:3-oxoacyl-[acyl-carrier protein] reductase
LLASNLLAPTRLVAEMVPHMADGGGGAVVLIGSITGVEATPAPLPYGAAKAALLNYTKNVAREVAKRRVRVNCVAPGNIMFEGGSWDRRMRASPRETASFIASEVPLERFGTVEEVANVVTFLVSDRASFVTGTCVVVDGGQTRSI